MCNEPQAEVSRSGIDDGVLAAVRLLLAPPESVGPNATAAHFTQPGEPEEERRVRQVGGAGPVDLTQRFANEVTCGYKQS